MNKHSGFSLIEILISVILLGVTALGLAKFNAIQTLGTTVAKDQQYATRLAEGLLEEVKQSARIRQAPVSPLNGVALSTVSGTEFTGSKSNSTSTFNVNVKYSVAPDWIDDAATTDDTIAFKAQVHVNWVSADGKTQNVVLVNDINYVKSADTAAPAMPSSVCRWDNAQALYPQGSWTIKGTEVFFCYKAGGCAKGAHNHPNAKPDEWKAMTGNPTPAQGGVCNPPNPDGSPRP
ncbi:prepilin-type N-terminal cleavage/methylation domain-containing protein [Deefgea tanakiae]|jgi:prepilin-type N-terminal cleavage/methylation domain-containing protein|uniref:Prepilin-type N-terminal cleavage/methylation domain-containing protein n=1 Tax=Deefgea tanakiae TaxID=2865840 RepID=A0ABX8Z1K3_9NEIS|nr:prepilin-type N-terminal cleavage/methylation domain-containing protein [Deefgea tanakiae]QZA76446.1 prepilin-type N-terminal cleavage/methylation domain-containing protein [Deefgea tanakiae]